MTAREKARALAGAIADKQGSDIRVLELEGVSAFTDFFVIASGTSQRHVQTLAEAAIEAARARGERPLGVEGLTLGRWVLVDLGDVVVHLFDPEARAFYALERLWEEAESIPVEGAETAARAGGGA